MPKRQLAGIVLGVGDESVDRLHAQVRTHDQQRRLQDADCDRLEILGRLEVQLLRKVLGDDDGGRRGEQQRVAVGGSLRDHRGAEPRARAGLVLDDEALAEMLLDGLRGDPSGGVDARSGADRDDHPDGTIRIVRRILGAARQTGGQQHECSQRTISEWLVDVHNGSPPDERSAVVFVLRTGDCAPPIVELSTKSL